ncbi:NADP-dependent oxidoreductase [Mucilaginibacter paludis]|nr:NADP-dependent oxidoreductase [Mucilaginibacter paludis]
MKAIILSEPGSINNLTIREIPLPEINPGEVLIKVKAIGINPVDAKTRSGGGVYKMLSKETSLILGWDISGEIAASRSDVFKVGDQVFGMVNFPGAGKAYAEYVAAPDTHLALKPENISYEEAAAATLAPLTALQVLRNEAAIKPGDRVLIHAASGGVGHYAIQIAKHLGAYVIGTSSAANRDFIFSLGADEHIDYNSQTLQEASDNVDFVLDSLGVDAIIRSLEVIKKGGKLISIVTQMTEDIHKKADQKNISTAFYLVQSNGNDMNTLAGWLKTGVLKSHVSNVLPFEHMAKAHKQIESGRTVDKIVVTI